MNFRWAVMAFPCGHLSALEGLYSTTGGVVAQSANVAFGSWSCENALAEALTRSDDGEVTVFGHFAEFGGSSVWKCS
jgi:hypothetical protein